jgi:hypothetical protein
MADATGLPPAQATEYALRASAGRAAENLRILRTIAADLGQPLPAVVDDAIVALRTWAGPATTIYRPTSRAGHPAPRR